MKLQCIANSAQHANDCWAIAWWLQASWLRGVVLWHELTATSMLTLCSGLHAHTPKHTEPPPPPYLWVH